MTRSTVALPAEDPALLENLRAGNHDAFAALVHANTGRLLAVARRMLRQEQEAQDAVQEAFLSAFKALSSFEGQCRLSTWLHRIAVNACLMRLRRRERRPEEAIEDLLPAYQPDGHTAESFRPWDGSALERLERDERRDLVRAAIDRLPETYRTALLLRDIEEMASEDAARLLGITPNALKIRVHRARQVLRTLLDAHVARLAERAA